MDASTVVVLVILGLCVIGGIVVVIEKWRKRRWAGEAEDHGWHHEPEAAVERAAPFAYPPFDIGLSRDVDEFLTGHTAAGTRFQAFTYAYDDASGPGLRVRIAALELPFGLPECYVQSRDGRARGAHLPEVVVNTEHAAQIQVRTTDPDFARAALLPQVWPLLADWAAQRPGKAPLDLSFDGASLVALDVPDDPDDLAPLLERLDGVVAAIKPAGLQAWSRPVKQPRLGFRDRDWVWSAEDDTLHTTFSEASDYTTDGFAHETKNVVRGSAHGLPLVAFTHTWGRISRSPQPDTEHVVALQLPIRVPDLLVARRWLGAPSLDRVSVRTGHAEFDRMCMVRTDAPRFAHDVLGPQLDFLLEAGAPTFSLNGEWAIVWPNQLSEATVITSSNLLAAVLGGVPARVWATLGTDPPVPPSR